MRASTGSALNLKEKPTKSDKRKSEPPADGLRDAPPPKEGIKSFLMIKNLYRGSDFIETSDGLKTLLHRIEKGLNFYFLGEFGRPEVAENRRFFRKKTVIGNQKGWFDSLLRSPKTGFFLKNRRFPVTSGRPIPYKI